MKKRVALILLTLLSVIFVLAFATACDVEDPNPDKLGIAGMGTGERLWTGIQVFILGLAMVFIVLFLLIGCIKLVEYLIALPEKVAKKKAVEHIETEKREAEQAAVAAPEQQRAEEEEDEVVAVITAALMAYYCGGQPVEMSDLPFRVRSIKEIK